MASVKELGNNKYRVFICNGFKPNGKVNRTSKVITARSMADAKKQAAALEIDYKRGEQVQLAHAPTFNDLVEKWRELKKSKMEHKTQERYEGFLNGFMMPYFGKKKVKEIRPLNILEYLNTLEKEGVRLDGKKGGYSEKTIHHHYGFIHSLLEFAVELEWIEYNTCDKVKAPKVEKHEAKYYEDENIDRLLDCLEAEFNKAVNNAGGMNFNNLSSRQRTEIFTAYMRKNYILLALVSACRRGEMVGLKVDDVDFKNDRIIVRQECLIYKAAEFSVSDEIIYIPDIYLNGLAFINRRDGDDAESYAKRVVDNCYTGQDFLDECGGDVELAQRLFYSCDWQHPSSALPEMDDRETDEEVSTAPAHQAEGQGNGEPKSPPSMRREERIQEQTRKPSIKEQLAAKPVSGDQPAKPTKLKDKGAR